MQLPHHDDGLTGWLEERRLMASPRRRIEVLRLLLVEDDDPLLVYDYDEISDPKVFAIERLQQRAAGQRHRRLRRLEAKRRHHRL